MLTTGSKYLFGSAALALVGAFFLALATAGHEIGMASFTGALTLGYKGPVGDHFGYAMLVGYAGVAILIGAILSVTRDGDPERGARIQGLAAPAPVMPARGVNHWPAIMAGAAAFIILGLVESPYLFIFGCIAAGVSAMQWTLHAWSDRATADPIANRKARETLTNPLDFPLFAILAIFLFVFGVSRILLALPHDVDTAVFGGVPAVAFVVAIILSFRPSISRKVITTLAVIGVIIVFALGIIGLVQGPKEIEKEHHTTYPYELKGTSQPAPISVRIAGKVNR